VTEYAEENLAEILPDRPLTPAETGEMLGPLLDALTYLHGKGFAHGRVKPSNILVVNDRVKLSWDNLHVERKAGNDSAEPAINDAPEAASGTLSPSADIWSLGVTLVEALTQHPPLWDRLAESDPVVPDSVPEPFAEIARECLHSDPTRRCTLSDIKARLEKDRSLPEPPAKISEAIPAKFRVWAVVAAVVVLLAVIGVALLRSHQSEPLPPPTEAMQPAPAMTARPSPSKPTATHGARAVTAKDRAVSTKDGVVEQVMPDIPQKAMATIRGRVRASIRVTVDSNGNVSNAAIDSTGSSYFADRALAAAKRWRFKPAQVNGHAVTSEWILRFEFTSSSAEVAPARVSP
jgi:TonB family protein